MKISKPWSDFLVFALKKQAASKVSANSEACMSGGSRPSIVLVICQQGEAKISSIAHGTTACTMLRSLMPAKCFISVAQKRKTFSPEQQTIMLRGCDKCMIKRDDDPARLDVAACMIAHRNSAFLHADKRFTYIYSRYDDRKNT